jgi:hypothetical protein
LLPKSTVGEPSVHSFSTSTCNEFQKRSTESLPLICKALISSLKALCFFFLPIGMLELLVRSPHRSGPKAESGSISRPGRGRPTDPCLVGPRRTVLYRGGGGHGSPFEVNHAATNPTYNLSDRGSTGAAGSTTIAAADILLHDQYTVPSTTSTSLPQHRPHRAGAVPVTSTPSRESPCYLDRRDGQPVGTVPIHC